MFHISTQTEAIIRCTHSFDHFTITLPFCLQAVQQTLDLLKQYAGIVAANDTLQQSTFNYHIIPGRALTMTDLMKLNKTSTRSNETLYIWHRKWEISFSSAAAESAA